MKTVSMGYDKGQAIHMRWQKMAVTSFTAKDTSHVHPLLCICSKVLQVQFYPCDHAVQGQGQGQGILYQYQLFHVHAAVVLGS